MRSAVLAVLIGLLLMPAVKAQELGIYGDYFRHSQTDANLGGLGLRIGAGVLPHLRVEGEMAYDFQQTFA